jgi:hypothetical protein
MKHGQGIYTWMGEENDDGERAVKATYTGSYADGKRCGVGKMTFPNGDVYEGEWKDNKVRLATFGWKCTFLLQSCL